MKEHLFSLLLCPLSPSLPHPDLTDLVLNELYSSSKIHDFGILPEVPFKTFVKGCFILFYCSDLSPHLPWSPLALMNPSSVLLFVYKSLSDLTARNRSCVIHLPPFAQDSGGNTVGA